MENIAMKCTRKEYYSMREQLLNANIKESDFLFSFADNENVYLTNSFGGNELLFSCVTYGRTVYETFDKDIFLKACGIEIPKTEILEEFNKRLGDKRIAMFKKAQSVVRGLGAEHCNITYIGTDSGYAINAEGGTELDGSFTITITGNKTK